MKSQELDCKTSELEYHLKRLNQNGADAFVVHVSGNDAKVIALDLTDALVEKEIRAMAAEAKRK